MSRLSALIRQSILWSGWIFAALSVSSALALVPQSQIERLDGDLTPMGSERARNADGTIPAWTGGFSAPPANVTVVEGQHLPDPFPNEKPFLRIDRTNMAEHAAQLTAGQMALMERFPTYFMDIYPSHRSCALPPHVYQAAKNNAAVGELVADGNGVAKAIMARPFPIPNNALELIWNHTLRYRGFKLERKFTAIPVTQNGGSYHITVEDDAILRWSDPRYKAAEDLNNVSILYLLQTKAPARMAGYVVLVQESLNMAIEARNAWTYSPGMRRVRRAPTIAYDNPGTNSDGITTSDSYGGFNGAPDRFLWTVRQRSEKYVAYNNYRRLFVDYDTLIGSEHINPNVMRYERHRVWEVEATLNPAYRHVYSKRIFYIDEDSGGIMATEVYDGRGELWRVQQLGGGSEYRHQICGGSGETIYDLMVGRYLAIGLTNQEGPINFNADHLDPDRYTPSNMRRLGR